MVKQLIVKRIKVKTRLTALADHPFMHHNNAP